MHFALQRFCRCSFRNLRNVDIVNVWRSNTSSSAWKDIDWIEPWTARSASYLPQFVDAFIICVPFHLPAGMETTHGNILYYYYYRWTFLSMLFLSTTFFKLRWNQSDIVIGSVNSALTSLSTMRDNDGVWDEEYGLMARYELLSLRRESYTREQRDECKP